MARDNFNNLVMMGKERNIKMGHVMIMGSRRGSPIRSTPNRAIFSAATYVSDLHTDKKSMTRRTLRQKRKRYSIFVVVCSEAKQH